MSELNEQKFGFVIPVYNHGAVLESVIQKLVPYNFPIIVVDDGNDEKNKTFINDIATRYSLITLLVHPKNKGKGEAMKTGVRKAEEMGLTHIFQVDSDGQHDTDKIPVFLELSKNNPKAIICSYPEYDESAPHKRVVGRKISNAWVHIVSLTSKKQIRDALIGFRIYPVAPYCKALRRHAIIDSHMGYDIDILVHLVWMNVPVISESVKVHYPKDGVSNFRTVRDTLHISLTYSRLCLGMFLRFPILITRKLVK